jgi:hypothetical protein
MNTMPRRINIDPTLYALFEESKRVTIIDSFIVYRVQSCFALFGILMFAAIPSGKLVSALDVK